MNTFVDQPLPVDKRKREKGGSEEGKSDGAEESIVKRKMKKEEGGKGEDVRKGEENYEERRKEGGGHGTNAFVPMAALCIDNPKPNPRVGAGWPYQR